ncbi:MAG: bifunctional (p)ppGpp synthetase/guanosine-3',5'-bis(diphosphate) 3'-pyrophosphohydrolase [Gammaproteobacteria bacterium]|nr:MAG: bifunctional (p)ppGpp synthetase/guanosine-3',5'-bis(diphosphate) 3'-pyrophosphohydrolase [Gammaproteobacteria bacterium]
MQPSNPTREPPPRPQAREAGSSNPDAATHGGVNDAQRLLIGDLCDVLETYLEPRDVADVYRAYLFSAEAHTGQNRRSGEPYIYHPISVAHILTSMHLDARTLSAAILHDVIEDTGATKEQIAGEFGAEIAGLVDGVSKITRMEFASQEEAQAENFRKMLLAMAADIRVILIKLADRLHNMRTIAAMPLKRRRAIARETLDIYAPIGNRLGVRAWAIELEDLAFDALYPMRHRILADAVRRRRANRKAIVEKVRNAIVGQLRQEGLEAEVHGREKNVYSIYKKMEAKHLSFDQVHDVYGFRVIVDKVDNCYRALGVIHNLYKPIPGRFKDYIAIPKANGYQSLHTVVFGPFGVSIEVQIRTHEMHRVAEAGVASHWLYKNGDDTDAMPPPALQWLKDLLDTQQKAGNPREFLEHLKVDLFPDEVYVFTPNGEIKKLPRGATVIDFAYDVHTDVGNRCVGAKVNHQLAPLRTVLRNGDHVEVITAEWSHPNPAWLGYVVTSKARAHIRNHLKNQRQSEALVLGERLLSRALEDLGTELALVEPAARGAALASLRLPTWEALLTEIGLGNRLAAVVARQLIPSAAPAAPVDSTEPGKAPAFAIRGTEGVVVSYARCCRPIPGDPILGFLSAGRGIVVHAEDCKNVAKFRKHPEQWIDVQWADKIEGVFPVSLRVDVKNQRGVLASVAAAIAEQDANIDTVNFDDRDGQYTSMDFTVEVRDRVHLARILRAIRRLETVVRVNRKKG